MVLNDGSWTGIGPVWDFRDRMTARQRSICSYMR